MPERRRSTRPIVDEFDENDMMDEEEVEDDSLEAEKQPEEEDEEMDEEDDDDMDEDENRQDPEETRLLRTKYQEMITITNGIPPSSLLFKLWDSLERGK